MDELSLVTVKKIKRDILLQDIEDKTEWFHTMDRTLDLSHSLAEGFRIIHAAGLARVKQEWDSLDYDIRENYDLQFRVYAQLKTPGMEWSTIDNWIRAAETFILEQENLPFKTVEIPKRINGKPVMENGKPVMETVEFDPVKIPISKLIICRAAAHRGLLNRNPSLLTALVDDNCTVDDVRAELYSEDSKEAGIDPEIRFRLTGPIIYAQRNGDEAVIIDEDGINWLDYYDEKSSQHEFVYEAINEMLQKLGIKDLKRDEKAIYEN